MSKIYFLIPLNCKIICLHYYCDVLLFWNKRVACMERKHDVFDIGSVVCFVNVDILLFNLLSISHILSK